MAHSSQKSGHRFRLVYHAADTLPQLAWCAIVHQSVEEVTVLHGSAVEARENFFIEGAWAGDFELGDFETSHLMGSGGKVVPDGLLVATPSHTLEHVFVMKNTARLLVSNSLPFVLAEADDDVDVYFLRYTSRITSVIYGLKAYDRTIPTRNRQQVFMYCHANLRIGPDLVITEEPKAAVSPFSNYKHYKRFLEQQVRAIHVNANDASRHIVYRPIATISSGYDSPASAVLARQVGCREAITFEHARPRSEEQSGESDSGSEIAALLGMKVKSYERLDYLRGNSVTFPEAECGASEFLSCAQDLKGRILFTGFNDNIWNPHCKVVSPDIVRKDPSGNNLGEFRMRVGFIHLPIPYLGCAAHPSIHKISKSAEMDPWRIGGKYDKPIARRLVEEAGVPRDRFGIKKKAVAVVVRQEGLSSVMTEASYQDFSRFCQEYSNLRLACKCYLVKSLYAVSRWDRQLRARFHGAIRRATGLQLQLPRFVPKKLELLAYSSGNLLFFEWSISKLLPRYRVAKSSHELQKL